MHCAAVPVSRTTAADAEEAAGVEGAAVDVDEAGAVVVADGAADVDDEAAASSGSSRVAAADVAGHGVQREVGERQRVGVLVAAGLLGRGPPQQRPQPREELLEVLGGADADPEQVVGIARHRVAGVDLGDVAQPLGDVVRVAGVERGDGDEGGQRGAERGRVDRRGVPGDDAALLEAPHPLVDG